MTADVASLDDNARRDASIEAGSRAQVAAVRFRPQPSPATKPRPDDGDAGRTGSLSSLGSAADPLISQVTLPRIGSIAPRAKLASLGFAVPVGADVPEST